jgi:RNA polymerase sigma-70 factor (ECF subfamily)
MTTLTVVRPPARFDSRPVPPRPPGSAVRHGSVRDLHDRYRSRVQALCYRYLGNLHDAQEVTQEVFAVVFRRIDGFRGEASLWTWLHRVTVNACIDVLRARRARPAISLDAAVAGEENGLLSSLADGREPMPHERVAHRELEIEIQNALAGLSDRLREIIELFYFEGLTYGQLSERLGISVGTVKSRLSRGRAMLGRFLLPVLSRHSA